MEDGEHARACFVSFMYRLSMVKAASTCAARGRGSSAFRMMSASFVGTPARSRRRAGATCVNFRAIRRDAAHAQRASNYN